MKKLLVFVIFCLACGPVEIIDQKGKIVAVDRDHIKTKTKIKIDFRSEKVETICNCSYSGFCLAWDIDKGRYNLGYHFNCPGHQKCEETRNWITYNYRYVVEEHVGESWEGHSEPWVDFSTSHLPLSACK